MVLAATALSFWQTWEQLLLAVIGGDDPVDPLRLHQIAVRTVIVFILGLGIVRIGKSRLLGRVTALDVLLGFMLGSLLARGITGHASVSGTAVASAVLVFLHWLLTALACRWHTIGLLIKGNCHVLVQDGEVNDQAMLHSHFSRHDLEEAIRLRGLESMEQVHLALKERNGEISVIPRSNTPRVLEISVQEGVQTVRIQL